ncbi:MAG: SsrA-binding protein [Crocinitomicaceae bacterium]|nr:SsrA-binding protein [Crocinitomicaceae bacterium]
MENNKVNIKNKKASFNYEFIDTYEAGMQLLGTEIKSIRNGKASIAEAYCTFIKDELFILNMHITEYDRGGFVNHEPLRKRKLLLHKHELEKLQKKLKDQGLTIIPIRLYISKSGYAKLQIALAKGKKTYDKREDLKEKDAKRNIDRLMKY